MLPTARSIWWSCWRATKNWRRTCSSSRRSARHARACASGSSWARHERRGIESMTDQYVPLCVAPEQREEPALWFAFRRAEIVVLGGAARRQLPFCMDLAEHGLTPQRAQYLGLYGNRHCYAAALAEADPLPEGWST